MQSKVKLTKRQIKEDKFTTTMLTVKQRLLDNWQYYVSGVVIVALVISATVYYINDLGSKQDEAAGRFSRAMLDYRTGDNEIAVLGFSQILEEFGGTEVAEQATYQLGEINLADRNYDEAVRHFEMFLANYHDNPLSRAASLAGLAVISEDRGEFSQAAAYYVRASEEHPGGPMQADYELGAIRNYLEVGDTESARDRLKILEEKHESSPYTQRAILLLAEKGNG
ncbi:MAG: hypothetical protein DRP45_00625 [Candidatus Zixiibacteriota bacterium]|nr:MAG: hypothetical protein DRP45_00625 [candidate division Zixibacteria bacterium]